MELLIKQSFRHPGTNRMLNVGNMFDIIAKRDALWIYGEIDSPSDEQ